MGKRTLRVQTMNEHNFLNYCKYYNKNSSHNPMQVLVMVCISCILYDEWRIQYREIQNTTVETNFKVSIEQNRNQKLYVKKNVCTKCFTVCKSLKAFDSIGLEMFKIFLKSEFLNPFTACVHKIAYRLYILLYMMYYILVVYFTFS